MKLDRLKAPALAATAVLLISGVASAFAAGPAPTTPTVLPAPVVESQSGGADTDTLQAGDQTTPNVPGAAQAPEAAGPAEPLDAAGVVKPAEATGTESDGPGGHADAAGQNVDHQFDGEE